MRRLATAVALALVALVVWASPSGAAKPAPAPDFEVTFPAGVACADFDLTIQGTGGNRVYREFVDEDGNVVRSISAGTGSALTYINVTTGASMATRSNGAVMKTYYNPDGSYTQVATGHNVIILFPTDDPPGPSTTLYVGRVAYTIGTDGVFTLQSANGKSTDICAALS